MKLDLDDIERKAKNGDRHRACCGITHMQIGPPVVLSLIARIGELETTLSSLSVTAAACGATFEAALARAVLEKGVVLP